MWVTASQGSGETGSGDGVTEGGVGWVGWGWGGWCLGQGGARVGACQLRSVSCGDLYVGAISATCSNYRSTNFKSVQQSYTIRVYFNIGCFDGLQTKPPGTVCPPSSNHRRPDHKLTPQSQLFLRLQSQPSSPSSHKYTEILLCKYTDRYNSF